MYKGTIPNKWGHCQPKITNFKFWPPCNPNRPLFLECVVHHLEAEHVEDALCPDQFFLPAAEAVEAQPGNNLVQLDGADDQEYDDQDHAHVQHQQHVSQSVSLNDFLGMVSHSRIENQDRQRQEREKDLEELQNMLKYHLPWQGLSSII